MRPNTTVLVFHILSFSVDFRAVQMHHPMRVAKMTDKVATKTRVETFEILKEKINSATKNMIILSTGEFHKREPSAGRI